MPKDTNAYPQMPIEEISEQKYNEMMSKINNHKIVNNNHVEQYFGCTGDHCSR